MNKPTETLKKLFPEEVKAVQSKKCPLCKDPIDMDGFKDVLSRKEYTISGMCQSCQDEIFD